MDIKSKRESKVVKEETQLELYLEDGEAYFFSLNSEFSGEKSYLKLSVPLGSYHDSDIEALLGAILELVKSNAELKAKAEKICGEFLGVSLEEAKEVEKELGIQVGLDGRLKEYEAEPTEKREPYE